MKVWLAWGTFGEYSDRGEFAVGCFSSWEECHKWVVFANQQHKLFSDRYGMTLDYNERIKIAAEFFSVTGDTYIWNYPSNDEPYSVSSSYEIDDLAKFSA